MTWDFWLNVQIYRKLFLFWGSYNNLHGILLSWGLFIVKRSILERALQYILKQTIISSSFWDISNLVFGTFMVTDWSPNNLVDSIEIEGPQCLHMTLIYYL